MRCVVNPYQWLKPPLRRRGCDELLYEREGAPHCFATSAAAYCNLFTRGEKDQSILVSESGAGKTETAKIVMNHLSLISGNGTPIVQKVLESNPILESFGNAATMRNDNSVKAVSSRA